MGRKRYSDYHNTINTTLQAVDNIPSVTIAVAAIMLETVGEVIRVALPGVWNR